MYALACQQVIALRLARIARGGSVARREATRMVAEKAAAAVKAQLAGGRALATGGPASAAAAVTGVYRRAVQRNRRRLTRS